MAIFFLTDFYSSIGSLLVSYFPDSRTIILLIFLKCLILLIVQCVCRSGPVFQQQLQ